MAGKVFFSVSMSLDGFIAPESLEDLMGQQWMELQQWIFPLRFFRENLKLGEGGEEGRDNDIVRETFERTGASVMGKRMFDLGGGVLRSRQLPLPDCVGQVGHPRRRLRADRLQGQAARVHALEQADSGAEQHG